MQKPILSRSSHSRVMMKRCRPRMTQLFFRGASALVWSGFCFWAAPPYRILLYSWLFKSKCQSQTCYMHTHTDRQIHTHAQGGAEGCSVVSDFQLIRKHKRPLCLASTTLPLLIHSTAQFLSGSHGQSLHLCIPAPSQWHLKVLSKLSPYVICWLKL